MTVLNVDLPDDVHADLAAQKNEYNLDWPAFLAAVLVDPPSQDVLLAAVRADGPADVLDRFAEMNAAAGLSATVADAPDGGNESERSSDADDVVVAARRALADELKATEGPMTRSELAGALMGLPENAPKSVTADAVLDGLDEHPDVRRTEDGWVAN